MIQPKPVDAKLVKATEKILRTRFTSVPMYAFANTKEIEEVARANEFLLSGVYDKSDIRDFDKLLETVSYTDGVIYIHSNALIKYARALDVSTSDLSTAVKLHSMGHSFENTFTRDKVVKIARKDAEMERQMKNNSTSGHMADNISLSDACARIVRFREDYVSCGESFCQYLMLESSKEFPGRLHQAATSLDEIYKKNKKYSYSGFFDYLVAQGLPCYYPFTDFPKRIPTFFDMEHPSLYVEEVPAGKVRHNLET